MSDAEIFNSLFILILVIVIPFWRRYYFFPKNIAEDKKDTLDYNFFSFIRGVSILAIVLIHVIYFYQIADRLWQAELLYFLNNASRFAIAIFFISSGILLTPWKEVDDKNAFYKRKFLRIFLPYILVMTVASVYYQADIFTYLKVLFTGGAFTPYYFIIVLAQLYLLFPLLSTFSRHKYFLLLIFVFAYPLTIVFDPILIGGATFFSKFLFFFAYGIYMRDFFLGAGKIARKEIQMWWAIVVIYLAICTLLPNIYYNFQIFYGLAFFNIMYYYRGTLKTKLKYLYKAFVSIGKNSLWIFLIHFQVEMMVYSIVAERGLGIYTSVAMIFSITSVLAFLLALILDKTYKTILKMASLK